MNKKLLPVILITSLSLQSCKLFNSLFPNTKPLELNNVVYTCKEMSEFKIYKFDNTRYRLFKTTINYKQYYINYVYRKNNVKFKLTTKYATLIYLDEMSSKDYITYKDNDHKYSIVIDNDPIWKKYSGKTLNIIATDLGDNYSISHVIYGGNYKNDFYNFYMYYNYSCGILRYNNETIEVVTYYEDDNTYETYSIINNKKGDFLYSGNFIGDQNKTTYNIANDNLFNKETTSFDIYKSDEDNHYLSSFDVEDDDEVEEIVKEFS